MSKLAVEGWCQCKVRVTHLFRRKWGNACQRKQLWTKPAPQRRRESRCMRKRRRRKTAEKSQLKPEAGDIKAAVRKTISCCINQPSIITWNWYTVLLSEHLLHPKLCAGLQKKTLLNFIPWTVAIMANGMHISKTAGCYQELLCLCFSSSYHLFIQNMQG